MTVLREIKATGNFFGNIAVELQPEINKLEREIGRLVCITPVKTTELVGRNGRVVAVLCAFDDGNHKEDA